MVFLEAGAVAHRAVPGDDPGIRVREAQTFLHGRDEALDGAPAVQVDVRIQTIEKYVPHVQHVALGEKDDAVAIGVAARHVVDAHGLAVQVQRDAVIERHHGQRLIGIRGRGAVHEIAELLGGHALADVVVRDDDAAGLAQGLVAADVVAVIVGVDDESHRAVVDLADRRQQLLGQRLHLIIDDEHAIFTGGHGDVAAPALDHGDGVGQPGGDVLDLVFLRGECRRTQQAQDRRKQDESFHWRSLMDVGGRLRATHAPVGRKRPPTSFFRRGAILPADR